MKKNRYLTFAPIVIFSSFLIGCIQNDPCIDMQFEHLLKTDRIILTNSMGKEIKLISVNAKIREITDFALSHNSEWAIPWAGTPVAKVRANFYHKDNFIGDLGVGSNFLTAQGCGYFQTREVSKKDRELIMGLFSVTDPYAIGNKM